MTAKTIVDLRSLATQIRVSVWSTGRRCPRQPTCSVKPGLNDKLVDCFRVDDVRKAGCAEVAAVGVDGYVSQIDVGFHRCETNVTEPSSSRSTTMGHHENVSTHHCSLIISKKSRWYTIRSNTEPSASPSCLLNVAENPKIGTAS